MHSGAFATASSDASVSARWIQLLLRRSSASFLPDQRGNAFMRKHELEALLFAHTNGEPTQSDTRKMMAPDEVTGNSV